MKNALVAGYRAFCQQYHKSGSASERLQKNIQASSVKFDLNVWQDKFNANQKRLEATRIKMNDRWVPGGPAVTFILFPPLFCHMMDIDPQIGRLLFETAFAASIVMPIQIMDRRIEFTKAVQENIELLNVYRYQTSNSRNVIPSPPSNNMHRMFEGHTATKND